MQMQHLQGEADIQQLTEEIQLQKGERAGIQQQADRIHAERQQRAEEVRQLKSESSWLRDAVAKQSSLQNQTANSLVATQLTALDREVQSLP